MHLSAGHHPEAAALSTTLANILVARMDNSDAMDFYMRFLDVEYKLKLLDIG
jgi:hypothetical protein